MLDVLTALMDRAAGRAAYAEARFVREEVEVLSVRDGRVEDVTHDISEGVGVRVRAAGGWGFAATRSTDAAALDAALAQALAIAAAQPTGAATPRAGGDPGGPARGHWAGPCAIDPFDLALETKLGELVAAEAALRAGGDARLTSTAATARSRRVTQAFASTEGAACTQERTECGGGLEALAVDGAEAQTRTYPTSHGGAMALAGWEQLRALDLPGHAPRVAEEALALLSAPLCPALTTTVVIHGEQLALQIHESIGHALELDRILLGELSYAGTSWIAPADLAADRPGGPLRYGSPALNITADATAAGGLGTFGWDDEGTAARRTPLIVAGELRAALSDRESAAMIGLDASGGCARADGFARQPIVRMTNVSIEPGDGGSLDDLLADTGTGLYLESNRSWSIDDRRLQFQFATEVAREIRGGELGRLYRNPVYAGVTPRFWGSMDAVCGAEAWRLWGLTNCGKGEPGQVMAVSHGAAPARFRDVEVRSA
jgi:TldD protein